MRYRRLGQTEQMVSEVGLDVRAILAGSGEGAEAALRSAIDRGITVFTWDVSDAAEDVEPLIIRAAGVDRGRLLLVAVLDVLPQPEDIGPQVDAIASRLAEPAADGYLDVIALPQLPDAAQLEALAEVRRRGVARFVAYAGEGDRELPADLPAGVDLLLLRGAPGSDREVGVIVRAAASEAPALLEGRAVASVVAPTPDVDTLTRLLVTSY